MDPRWVEALRRDHPSVAVRVEQEGSCIRYSGIGRPDLGSELTCPDQAPVVAAFGRPSVQVTPAPGDAQRPAPSQRAASGALGPRVGPPLLLVAAILVIVAVFLLR